jgi:ADP-ribose pyrophosphatase
MADLTAYLSLVRSRPDLFRNPPDAGITILLDKTQIHKAEESVAHKLRAAGAPAEWAEVGVAFQDQYLLLVRDAVRFADGSLGTYIRAIPPERSFPGVVILPLWRNHVLLIRHFRHAARAWHSELPRGFGSDPDPHVSARRELTEEIGATGIRLVDLGEAYAEDGGGRVFYFLANVDMYGKPELHEAITDIMPTPVADFERMISHGKLKDGYLLIAYGLAKAKDLI